MKFRNEVIESIWNDRHRKNNETLEETFARVANHVSLTDHENEQFFDIMNRGLFVPAGRTMSNAGIGETLTLNNCFLNPVVEDDMGSIFESVKNGALTHKAGGGIGYDFSLIRPKNSITSNHATASGVISFMEVFNTQTATVMQGSRRGANMGVLNIYHPDIYDFINAKSTDASKFEHFNLSIMVDDDFMKAVKNNENIHLRYPIYDECYRIIKDSSKWITQKEIKATELWDMIMQKAYDNGEPGVLFYDTMNKYNNTWYTETITHTNPCFTGDMKLLTEKGYKTFEELCDKETNIINKDGDISKGKIWCSGEKEVTELKLSNKKIIRCTPDHLFKTNEEQEIQANELKGKRIKQFITDKDFTKYNPYFIKLGFIQGDGGLGRLNSDSHLGLEINIGKNDKEIWELFEIEPNGGRVAYVNGYNEDLIKYGFSENPLPTRPFPTAYDNWDKHKKLAFLRGCYSANGCVIKTSRIGYKTTCKDFAIKLSNTLNEFGYNSYITTNKPRDVKFSNGTYLCKENYDINIGRFEDCKKFYSEIGFVQNYKMDSLLNLIKQRSPKVISIKPIGIQKVYDFTEPKTHWGVVEGCIVHNCAEFIGGTIFGQELPSSEYGGACNLGSLILPNFVKKPFAKYASVDTDLLDSTIRTAVRMLDNIIDVNKYPLKHYENYQKNLRTIGLGTMGLADMLVMLGYKYSSAVTLDFVNKLMDNITLIAYEESVELSKEKGSFPFYNKKFLGSKFIQKHTRWSVNENRWRRLEANIEQYGIRNARLISQAPTGTIAMTYGNNCSSGIEPIFQLSYDRKIKLGGQNEDNIKIVSMENYAYSIYKEMKEEGLCDNFDESLFTTALDISVQDHIDILEVIASHTDMAVSKTINIPTEYTFEQVKNVYMKCWEKNIKGCTIFRPNALRQGIILAPQSDNNIDKDECINNEEKVSNSCQNCSKNTLPRGYELCVSDDLIAYKKTIVNGCGKFYVHSDFDDATGEQLETFIDIGSDGGCERNLQFISRLMSKLLRNGVSVEEIIDQAKSIRPCNAYVARTIKHGDTSKGTSCPSAIGFALEELNVKIKDRCFADFDEDGDEYTTDDKMIVYDFEKTPTQTQNTDSLCPDCQEPLVFEGGCNICKSCGWSKCN